MVEITPTKTETRLKRTTTIAAMIVIATSPLAVNKHAFSTTTMSTARPAMLKLTTPNVPVVIPLDKGTTTEVSDKAMKDQIGNFTGFPVNYDPKLTISQDIGNL